MKGAELAEAQEGSWQDIGRSLTTRFWAKLPWLRQLRAHPEHRAARWARVWGTNFVPLTRIRLLAYHHGESKLDATLWMDSSAARPL